MKSPSRLSSLSASIMKSIGISMLIPLSISVNAQNIISPDTVHVGDMVSFNLSGTDEFNTYAWEFETNTFKTLLTTSLEIPNTGTSGSRFDISSSSTMVYDGATKSYYSFVICTTAWNNSPNVQRIDFGLNPNNPNPATVNLGNPNNAFIVGVSYTNLQDFKVVKDDNGTYHAFINNGGIVHWVFGNGINNLPTEATRIFTDPSVLGMSMNMAVIKYNNSWHIFTGQTFGIQPGLVRLDLGPDLNAIPSNIPYNAFSSISNNEDLAYLAVLKENDNWYITICAHVGNSALLRFSFGNNLLNNNPVITDLGPSNPALIRNRGLNYLKTCDSSILIGIHEDGSIYKYLYPNNSVANAPIQTDLGQKFGSSVGMQALYPYWYKDTLWALTSNWLSTPSNTVYRFPLACFSPGANTSVNYYNSAASHVFNTTGIFDVEVYCDQGENRGPQSFCKQIVVVDPTAVKDAPASNSLISIYPNPATKELNLRMSKSGNFSYNICNAVGKVIFSVSDKQMVAGQVVRLNLDNYALNPGIYCLNLIAENGERYSTKFIKR